MRTTTPLERLNVIIVDPTRKIAVGGFREEQEGIKFMVSQGHSKENLVLVNYVSKKFWAQTGMLVR